MTRPLARPLGLALTGVLAAGVLAGCGGSDDGPGPDDPGSTSATPSPSDPPTSATTAPADPAAYLPVPDGSALTAPGTVLGFRESALAAWTPRQDLVGVVDVKVLGVERTSVEKSLAGYQLDPSAAESTPYFVTTRVDNRGDTDLGGRQLPIYVVDSDDRLVAPTGIGQTFEPCPGSTLPAVFAPGDGARSCLIFLLEPGTELESVMFRPPEGVVPITFRGTVVDLTKPRRPGKGGKPGARGAAQGGRG